ncbi:MAG: DUF86 domain-containing protein [Burkholderiales bacterium]|nr:DUF86 domain-containing protein [Anaerolineae bacterium]
MNERDEVRLRDMLDEARQAQKFIAGKTSDDLHNDAMLSYAVIRAVELIGEAASKVTVETREQVPQIQWQNIIGTRNRIIHDYKNVDLSIVWQIVTRNLPPLIEQLEKIVPLS